MFWTWGKSRLHPHQMKCRRQALLFFNVVKGKGRRRLELLFPGLGKAHVAFLSMDELTLGKGFTVWNAGLLQVELFYIFLWKPRFLHVIHKSEHCIIRGPIYLVCAIEDHRKRGSYTRIPQGPNVTNNH